MPNADGPEVRKYWLQSNWEPKQKYDRQGNPLPTPPLERKIAVTVVGSPSYAPDHNLELFGGYIAGEIIQSKQTAERRGNYFALDSATGGTPKTVWPALQRRSLRERVNFSHGSIFLGHEVAFGPKKGSDSDFDYQREDVLWRLGVKPSQITKPEQLTGPIINGNYIPMKLIDVTRDQFIPGEEGDRQFFEAEIKAAEISAIQFNGLVRTLRQRSDVTTLALMGIGTDGHFAEAQTHSQGWGRTIGLHQRDAFVQAQPTYSIENGAFYWTGDEARNSNLYWKRGMKVGQAYGRAVDYPSYGDQSVVVGTGWRDLLGMEQMILAFNGKSKSWAFQLALEGSADWSFTLGNGQTETIERSKGKGERILPALLSYARSLEGDLLPRGTTSQIERDKNKLNVGYIVETVYTFLDDKLNDITVPDATWSAISMPIYEQLGEFANNYLGKRAPVSRAIRQRTLQGKHTELVITPEVVIGTPYEKLVAL